MDSGGAQQQRGIGLVAAGSLAHPGLRQLGVERVPLLTRNNETILANICRCLLAAPGIGRVLLLAPEEMPLPAVGGVERAPYSGRIVADIFGALEGEADCEYCLYAAGDLPLLTPEAVAAVQNEGLGQPVDFVYPVADVDGLKRSYPQARKTSVRLGGRLITGGNVFYLRTKWLLELRPLAEEMVARRKNPLALARMFGPLFLLRVLLGAADLPYLEQQLGRVMRGRLKAALLPYPELALDLDKPSDLALFEDVLDPLPGIPAI